MWITPRSLDLSLAYEVGNLRDPRVGNIMTLDTFILSLIVGGL